MASLAEIDALEVILTAGCNLRCTYCYQNDKKARRMSWETLAAAIDLLLASRRRRLGILFIGGEPLLEFELIRRAVEYVRERRPPGKRMAFHLVTNGLLLDAGRARFLARHRFGTQLSFDATTAAQDLRGVGTFAALDSLLGQLVRDHPAFVKRRLTVSFTVTPQNLGELAEAVSYLHRAGVSAIALSPLITHDPSWRLEEIERLDAAFERLYRICLAHYRRTGEVPLELFRRDSAEAGAEGSSDPTGGGVANVHRPRADAMCGAPEGSTLAVDVDGQVHGCAIFSESYQKFPSPFLRERVESIRLGDLRSADLGERLASYPERARAAGIFHDKSGKYSSYGRCDECRYAASCAVCPASIGQIPGNTDPNRVPDFVCAFNLVSSKYRERFPVQPTVLEALTGRVRAYGELGEAQRRLRSALPGRPQAARERIGGRAPARAGSWKRTPLAPGASQ